MTRFLFLHFPKKLSC